MSSLKLMKVVVLLFFGAIALTGCAAKGPIDQQGNKLDPSELGNYAVAEVEILREPNSQQIEMVDGVSVYSFCQFCRVQEINLKPGSHRIVMDIGFDAAPPARAAKLQLSCGSRKSLHPYPRAGPGNQA